jgi:hypothetical protein
LLSTGDLQVLLPFLLVIPERDLLLHLQSLLGTPRLQPWASQKQAKEKGREPLGLCPPTQSDLSVESQTPASTVKSITYKYFSKNNQQNRMSSSKTP